MVYIIKMTTADHVTLGASNVYCCVPQCKGSARKNPNLSFHHFPRVNPKWPKDHQDRILQVRNEWARVLKITRDVTNTMVVCSSHFTRSDYFPTDFVRKRYLKKTAIPSFNLPLSPSELKARKAQQEADRNALTPNVVYITKGPQKKERRKSYKKKAVSEPKDKKGNTTSSNSPLKFNSSEELFEKVKQRNGRWCAVYGCKNRRRNAPNVSFFSFPINPEVRKEWVRRCCRPKGVNTKNRDCTICSDHFKEEEMKFVKDAPGPLSSKKRVVKRGVLPSLNLPKTLNCTSSCIEKCQRMELQKENNQEEPNSLQHSAATPRSKILAAKRRKTQNANNEQEISSDSNLVESPLIVKFQHREAADEELLDASDAEFTGGTESRDSDETDVADETVEVELMERIDFIDLTELKQKLDRLHLCDFWTLAKRKKSLAFVHIKLTNDAPRILVSVVIDENLSVSLFYGEERIKATMNFSFPTRVRNIIELKMILSEAKAKIFTELESSSKVESVQRLLDSLKQNMKKHKVNFSFLKEQVSLLADKQKQYSPEMLMFATLLFSMAPHAYKFLIQYENLVLPEQDIIKNLYIPLEKSPNKDPPITFLQHAKESFSNLKDSDKQIALQIEEIYLKPFLEVEGNITGMSVEMDAAATSVYVFMISSLGSNYKDTVHLLPVQSLKAVEIHNALKEVITGLECIGFRIVAVVTDDSLVNRQAMSFFSEPPHFNSIIYKHPLDSLRPLFHIISFAYLLKSIRNDWMIQNNQDECFFYPDIGNETDEQSIKKASFTTLKKLYDVESSSYLKCYSSFSSNAISPSNTEKHNIEFVLQIFNDIVSDRLLLYGEDHGLRHYQDTADFIKLICTWWSIVNPDSLLQENIKDQSYGALSLSEKSYVFLEKFLDWLDCWSDLRHDSGMLTAKTYSALHLSTYALIKLTAYCNNDLGMDFILPGNFQTDSRIMKFGYSREISSIQFIHKKDWPLCEPNLATLSNLDLTLMEVNDVNLTRLHCRQAVNLAEAIDYVNTFIPMVVTAEDMTSNEGNLPVLLYLGGCCVRSISKELNCEMCESHLTTDVDMVLHPAVCEKDDKLLKYPSKNTMKIVFLSFVVLSKLCKEHAGEFWTHTNRNSLAYNLTMNVLDSIKLSLDYRLCEKEHNSNKAVKMIVRSVVYSVLNNHNSCTSEIENV